MKSYFTISFWNFNICFAQVANMEILSNTRLIIVVGDEMVDMWDWKKPLFSLTFR